MKKNLLLSVLLLLSFTVYLSSCGSSSDDAQPTTSDLGTFLGPIQASDDPLTDLGYINNAKVSVSRNGSTITVKVTGSPGFDREYTGSILTEDAKLKVYNCTLNQQTKPSTKTVSGILVISGNALSFQASSTNDSVNAVDDSNGQTITLSGKINLNGPNMVRQ